MYFFADEAIKTTWHICLFINISPQMKLDWEHTDYAWIKLGQHKEYDVVPNLANPLNMLLI
jgi:hypothetical protein